jgi:hypothetical protein
MQIKKPFAQNKLLWVFLIVTFGLAALGLYQYKLQVDDEALRLSRLDKKNKLAIENSPVTATPDLIRTQLQSDQERQALQLKNDAGDLLSAPWAKWLLQLPKILDDDASIVEFRAELPRPASGKTINASSKLESVKALLQIEVRDDMALKRVLAKLSESNLVGSAIVESAADQSRGAEKFLLVRLSVSLAM